MQMNIPAAARMLLDRLEATGYAAYLVGGCVRDSLLGRTPGDWDIATGALPEQVIACFADYPVLETGIKHGTVTVLVDHNPYEVTTFRVDGAYTDNRRPDSVEFIQDLRADLARRDFTINALAWNPGIGLVDYFGGQGDLAAGRIVCVGEPDKRFAEDALRILRAVRFASTLGFAIASGTAKAMAGLAPSLSHIAPERIRLELDKAIVGPGVCRAFSQSPEVLRAALPELEPYMCKPGWPRCLQAVAGAARDLPVRLALLLHPCGEKAVNILLRLRYDNRTRRCVQDLLANVDRVLPAEERHVRRLLNRLDVEGVRRLLDIWRALQRAHGFAQNDCNALESLLEQVLAQGQCYRLRDLAVGGEELLDLGVTGPQIGRLLQYLLEQVIEGCLPNERAALLRYVVSYISNPTN